MGGANLGQRVSARHRDGIGIAPLGQQASALVPANPELLRKVFCCVSGTHDVPA
ncbi:Uncharacterised protein [Mycobacterium tuberculosis]|uniref:Uncharacterized protein n=1 Tax=Mycobacterium tuberculosis TaxID=1773 RepID=A0A916LDA5_MYCTX|nr:Uncharacterised protein [Mycobacterium tuberculosis]